MASGRLVGRVLSCFSQSVLLVPINPRIPNLKHPLRKQFLSLKQLIQTPYLFHTSQSSALA